MSERSLIFVIDDDPLIHKLIKVEFNPSRSEIRFFHYGEEGIQDLNLKPDLIILDFIFVNGGKQVMGGVEILQNIRRISGDVPVIILSGQESGSAVLELIRLGIEDYIIKQGKFIPGLKEAAESILGKL